MTSERAAFVALALTPGIGVARLHSILTACSTALGAFSAPFAFLRSIPGIGAAAATAIKARSFTDGEAAIAAAESLGAHLVIDTDACFPGALREIPDAPPLLFVQGRLDLLTTPAVAVVGSRDHTRYGADVCRAVSAAAAAAGVTVVSGMARGLDAEAHRAALHVRGNTIGVLGNGLGVIYPAANRALYESVAAEGLLLTEFPTGERPNAGSFPRRNRLISGLARVTVVVEAAVGSGALITATTALEQGRDVMAVPGPITSAVSVGTNLLIRDGAEPLLAPDDLLRHFPEATRPVRRLANALPADASAAAATVVGLLTATPTSLDRLEQQSGLPVAVLVAALSELEIHGAAKQHPGAFFSAIEAGPTFHRAER